MIIISSTTTIIISSIIMIIISSESVAFAAAHSQDHLQSTSQHFMLDQAGSTAHPPSHPHPHVHHLHHEAGSPPHPPHNFTLTSCLENYKAKYSTATFHFLLPPCQIEILLIVVIFLGKPGLMALWGPPAHVSPFPRVWICKVSPKVAERSRCLRRTCALAWTD